jgi:uncharacterized circularly permuted ATP-grasp superfamily protein
MDMDTPFNEMHHDSGKSRSHYEIFDHWLKKQNDVEMSYKRAEAELIFRRIGITFAVYGDEKGTERTIPFDQIPRNCAKVLYFYSEIPQQLCL